MPTPSKPKLLVFVIAYYAEATLRAVLERIPSDVYQRFECEVLVVDDASTDRTYAIGREFQASHPEIRMTVLRNEYNQGYGGNQKVGYGFAIAHGFDFVAMVHGDGQYAPEQLPLLLEPMVSDGADAVFGSRMLQPFGALKGGMPLYKYVGNRILSSLQNALLGTTLSEFHSGYRIYSVAALRKIRFHLNSNDFHFDTEIIIQLLNAGAKIVERPIPTYYGDEICRVNGLKYAKDVMIATLQNVAHRSGFLYQHRFDAADEGNTHYDLKLGYASSHTYAIDAVPAGSRVLDIGSGPGGIAEELLRKSCEVAVVDRNAPTDASGEVTVILQDLNEPLRFEVQPYDTLLLLDVIEHLQDPELFLERLRAHFTHDSKKVVISTPNVAFIVQRAMLLLGQFNYGKAGILDRTHTRLFTFGAAERLLRDYGFRIKRIRGVPAPFPKILGNGLLGRTALEVNAALIRVSKTLFSYQIFIEAESTPGVEFLVNDASVNSAGRGAPP